MSTYYTTGGRGGGYVPSWKLPEEKRPQFFKIIHSGIIQNEKLVIPPVFVRKIKTDLTSDLAILKVPTGDIWEVEIREENTVFSFRNGLKEFIDHYSISAGHFLVFRYDGNSQFYVLIFDISASEIDYYNFFKYDQTDKEPTKYTNFSDLELDLESEDDVMIAEPIRWRSTSIDTLDNFKSKFPFFSVIIEAAFMEHEYLPFPTNFVGRHLLENVKSIKVKVPDGRSWVMELSSSDQKEMALTKGFSKFMKSNAVKEGDVFVVEVIKKRYLILRVHIFHN